MYGRIRLINWIRKEVRVPTSLSTSSHLIRNNEHAQKPTPAQVADLQPSADVLSSDAYLIPVLEDDPLLRTPSLFSPLLSLRTLPLSTVLTLTEIEPEDSDWSDDDPDAAAQPAEPATLADATRAIHALQAKLTKAKQDLVDYRAFVRQRLDLRGVAEAVKREDANVGTSASASASVATKAAAPLRDDDSHYFQSYGENGAHPLRCAVSCELTGLVSKTSTP